MRTAVASPASATVGTAPVQTAAAQQHAADEAVASILLLFGVLFCGLLNAWSLGYLQPNRNVRRALSVLGCPLPELVR